MQKCDSGLKSLLQNCIVRRKSAILASEASSQLHFSTQKCDSGLISLLQNCIFRRKYMILASKTLFKIAFFNAKMRFWPQKPSSKLYFSMQKCDSGLKNLLQNCENAFLKNSPFRGMRAQWRVLLGRKTRHIIHQIYYFPPAPDLLL